MNLLTSALISAVRRARCRREVRRQFHEFQRRSSDRLQVRWSDVQLYLDDATPATGFDRHYVFHLGWAARVLARLRPDRHVDIGSLLYFAVISSAFIDVDFFDYRPASVTLSGLRSGAADLTQLPFADRSVKSLSCMHVVEHVGLGRYGDPLDPDADLRAMHELGRVLAEGGTLLFVVPVGRPRVVFNAHRIYAYADIVDAFGDLELEEFALIPDNPSDGDLIVDADPAFVERQEYGCGCFLFRRVS